MTEIIHRHQLNLDMYEIILGVRVAWDSKNPDDKYPVVTLLDGEGEDTEDEEKAVGGVIKLEEESFTIFAFPEKIDERVLRDLMNEKEE